MISRTKIVATLGPASDDTKTLCKMLEAGMDIARLNFSHGEASDHERRARLFRAAAEKVGRDVGIMGDLQGPKIRICRFKNHSVLLEKGDAFFLDSTLGFLDGDKDGVAVALDTIHEDLSPQDVLLLNDGMITLKVERIDGTRIHTIVVNGGILSDHKGINLKGGGLSAPALTDIDKENIKLAAKMDLDYLAVSFVRTGEDVHEARRLLQEAGGHAHIVAKIERTEAVLNIDSIIAAADVIMVARGDLGVEMGYAELTGIQKKLIRKTRKAHKIVITATQMMESMIQNPIPTRAEVSDVSNAVMDGTDALMLSGETAVGAYPVESNSGHDRNIHRCREISAAGKPYQPSHGRSFRAGRRGHCDGNDVHGEPHVSQSNYCADRIRINNALDVANSLRHSGVRIHAASSDQSPRCDVPRCLPGAFCN